MILTITAIKYDDVARAGNAFIFKYLPVGKCGLTYGTDGELPAGKKTHKANLNKNYR